MMAAYKWCGDWIVGGGCRGLRVVLACQEGSWEGGGSLVGVGDSVVPWGGDATCHDGNCTIGVVQFTVFLVVVGQFLHPGGAKLQAFAT